MQEKQELTRSYLTREQWELLEAYCERFTAKLTQMIGQIAMKENPSLEPGSETFASAGFYFGVIGTEKECEHFQVYSNIPPEQHEAFLNQVAKAVKESPVDQEFVSDPLYEN